MWHQNLPNGERAVMSCIFSVLTCIFMGLGGWQFHVYKMDHAYENRLAWHVCNTTEWRVEPNYRVVVTLWVDNGCEWENLPLFTCDGSDKGPLQCVRENDEKYNQASWSCVTEKIPNHCDISPLTSWPNTDYNTSLGLSILFFVVGGTLALALLLPLIAYIVDYRHLSNVGAT